MKKTLLFVSILIVQSCIAQFFPTTTLAFSSSQSGSAFLADIDNDGHDDVVQSDQNGNALRIFWNTNGQFSDQVLLNAQSLQGKCYASGDFDEDGDVDLACSTGWLENENFNFNTSHDYSPSSAIGGNIICEDVNGDSHLDLLLGTGGGTFGGTTDAYHFYSLLNDGQGNFTAAVTPAEELRKFSLVDIDQDGIKDVVTDNPEPYELRCSYGNGDGTFDPYVSLLANFNPAVSGFADFNGDSIQDLFAVSGSNLKIYYGQAAGGLAAEIVHTLSTDIDYWYGVDNNLTTDYDGDGDIDLMLRPENREIIWIENTAVGFIDHGNVLTTPDIAKEFVWTDLNNDGKMDGVEGSASFYTVIQHDDAILYTHQMVLAGGMHCGQYHCIADLNEDGVKDIISRGDIGWVGFTNDGYGNYASSLMGLTKAQYHAAASYFDFDRDGQQDLLTDFFGQGASYFMGKDNYHFKPVESILPELGSSISCWGYLEFDVNLDGELDLVVLTNSVGNRKVKWFEYDESTSWTLQGDLASLPIGTGNYWVDGLQSGDFNGDNITDLAVITLNDCYVLQGDASANYTLIQVFVSPNQNGNLKVSANSLSDINGDGLVDIVFQDINLDNNQVKIYYLKYNGTNYEAVQIASYTNTAQGNAYCIADFDGDSDIDVVYKSNTVLRRISNNGSGIFGAPVSLNITFLEGLERLSAVMIDNDNMPDMVLSGTYTYYGSGWIQVAINNLDSPFQIQFHAFVDSNGDGIQNNSELPLMNQQIYLGQEWGYIYTDELGQYHFYGSIGTTAASISLNPELWNYITPSQQSVELTLLNPTAEIFFAIQSNAMQPSVHAAIVTAGDVCGSEYVHWISVSNTGNTLATGSINYTLDSQFSYISAIPAPDVVNGNILTWNFASLYFNDIFQVEVLALSPDFNAMGQEATHTLNVELVDDMNNAVYADEIESTYTILCSYDPNDIQEQLGHTAAGYILHNGELQYLVRFQNLGNANAEYVRVEDLLSEKLDWSTLQVVGASHDFEHSINPLGKAIFIFEDIELPPATTDEIHSQGFICFRIKPISGLLQSETINNTATIFFDLNPPVATNTVVNTIYDCVDLQQATASATEVCAGDAIIFGNNGTWIENLTWTFEGIEVGSGEYMQIAAESGTMIMNASNALCSFNESIEILVTTLPIVSMEFAQNPSCNENLLTATSSTGEVQWFQDDVLVAEGLEYIATQSGWYHATATNQCGSVDSFEPFLVVVDGPDSVIITINNGVLTAEPQGVAYYWYLNGFIINGAEDQSYTPTIPGNYSVNVYYGIPCAITSDVFYLETGIEEAASNNISLYPNPASEFFTLSISNDLMGNEIVITDMLGKVVMTVGKANNQTTNIDCSALAAGIYEIRIGNADTVLVKK
jgi:hypothetical protein